MIENDIFSLKLLTLDASTSFDKESLHDKSLTYLLNTIYALLVKKCGSYYLKINYGIFEEFSLFSTKYPLL